MNTQRLTLITVALALVIIAGIFLIPRLQQGGEISGELDLTRQPSLGSEQAPVKIALFEDFRCPHCATFTETVFQQLKREYVDDGKVEVFYLNFPVLGPESETVALAGECVYQQSESAFWDLKEVLFRSQDDLDNSRRVLELAETYSPGIDQQTLRTCFERKELVDEVRRDAAMARKLGLTGTPSVVVNGERLTNVNFASVQRAIDRALAGE
ncbi:MAG: DsbA family protein [Trueperaceae bacterium]|nr:MAG: DsbA family protein [Trueperaceae bacterium]